MKLIKFLVVIIGINAILQLSGCNTTAGFGKDIQRGGQAIEKAAR